MIFESNECFRFQKALPIWEAGTQTQKNRTVSFVHTIDFSAAERTLPISLTLAGSSSYIVLINGALIAYGPARTAHGYYRVDRLDLNRFLEDGQNTVAIRVAGYNVNSFATLDQPSFLCAELLQNGKAIAYTGASSRDMAFIAYACEERLMRVQRYSFQRPFVETYRLDKNAFAFECGGVGREVPIEQTEDKIFIDRAVPYGEYSRLYPTKLLQEGKIAYSEKTHYYNSREVTTIGDKLKGYREEELEFASYREVGKMDFLLPVVCAGEKANQISQIMIAADTYVDLDMGVNQTGIFELEITAGGDGALYLLFDEVLKEDGTVDCFRLGTSSIVTFLLKKGTYRVTCAEPYVLRYLRLAAVGCEINVCNLRLCEIAFPLSAVKTRFLPQDSQMEQIYDAAVRTFRANTVDIYMDCPSRERAGWLCDSFFTSRVEYILTGKSVVERAFLQNFLLPDQFACLPEGMLPMCYPADHYDGVFIPNWAMWYAIELREYYERSHDGTLVKEAREKMYALIAYFRSFENEYGLLENLQSWVFVEWSKSNQLVQDVSFASNMLYAGFLQAIGQLYDDASLLDKAEDLRQTIAKMAITESGFFCDNAVRHDGKLVLSGECTESCQYYAFFFDVATPAKNPTLWRVLCEEFGYDRYEKGTYPQIYPANAFIGNYLRLDLLCRYGYKEVLADNIRGYFSYMAERTGTLWENVGASAGCNHGFASHVLYWMDALGYLSHEEAF